MALRLLRHFRANSLASSVAFLTTISSSEMTERTIAEVTIVSSKVIADCYVIQQQAFSSRETTHAQAGNGAEI
ncbi:MAG: hypothetical protein ACI9PY_000433 [Ascidiaceihabitans sp.]|jgi:hypothetical protein